ncbi:helix-turn-helix transcriptional regulator [Cereibacter changlensis]|uniref:Helix-turn-helix transcriptional regulator n=2 Tax=Cereibacter changlensis TaxID=402884 RepID=A0A4U0YZI7_9RHOB|nr:helix-turn-helix transcriptional regulator [Cereibacter changlensis]
MERPHSGGGRMQTHVARTSWTQGADAFAPQLFHRTDSFRFLEADGRIDVTRIGGDQTVLARVRSTGHDITLDEPERLTLLFPWAGRITCMVGDSMTHADAGGVLAFGPNRRRTVVTRPGRPVLYRADLLTMPVARLDETSRVQDLSLRRIAPYHDPSAAVIARIRSRVGMTLTKTEAAQPLPAAALQAALADLAVDLACILAQPDRPAASAGARRVAQALARMRAFHSEPISLAALAQDLGCSSRSLQVAFRDCGHPTPQQVLANIRLDAARVLLLSGERNVTACALDSGITHFGRFARAYRQRFGESPAETLGARG